MTGIFKKSLIAIALTVGGLGLYACGGGVGSSANSGSGGDGGDGGSSTKTLTSDVTEGTPITTAYGGTCYQLIRDTSSCQSTRTAYGFSGDWLSFSCNVKLTPVDASYNSVSNISAATWIAISFSGLPDHKSNYFATSGSYSFTDQSGNTVSGNYSDMHESYTTTFPNPNMTAQKSYVLYVPVSPAKNTGANSTHKMGLGVVGVAVDGIPIYNSVADASDNIYTEAGSFDQCQGHPDAQSRFHYHTLPYPISHEDSKVVGMMRDGFFIYGQYDSGGSSDLDTTTHRATQPEAEGVIADANSNLNPYVYGGHVGTVPTTGTGSIFHYHATRQYGCTDRAPTAGAQPRSNKDGDVYYSEDDAQDNCVDEDGAGSSSPSVIDAYFLTGHGNGGTFVSPPDDINNDIPAQRYYYGTAGTCTGC